MRFVASLALAVALSSGVLAPATCDRAAAQPDPAGHQYVVGVSGMT
jgi:hypothetical protein